jgi:hypothetical protein
MSAAAALVLPPAGAGPSYEAGAAVVACFSNAGYMPYVRNLFRNCAALALPWRPLVLCADAAAAAAAAAAGLPHVDVAPLLAAPADEAGFLAFGDAAYRRFVFRKLDALRLLTQALLPPHAPPGGAERFVLYLDADVHLFADPVPFVAARFAARAADVLCQCDEGVLPLCARQRGAPLCGEMCTGVMALRVSAAVAAALDYGAHATRPLAAYANNDQTYVNELAGRGALAADTLPRALFPNGRFLGAVPPDALLLHYNWLVGDDKRRRMAAAGHWYEER